MSIADANSIAELEALDGMNGTIVKKLTPTLLRYEFARRFTVDVVLDGFTPTKNGVTLTALPLARTKRKDKHPALTQYNVELTQNVANSAGPTAHEVRTCSGAFRI